MPLLKKKNSRNRAQDFFFSACSLLFSYPSLSVFPSSPSPCLHFFFHSFSGSAEGSSSFSFSRLCKALLFPNIFRIINSVLVHLHFSGIHVWWEVCFLSLLLGGTHFTKLIRQNPTSPSSATHPPSLCSSYNLQEKRQNPNFFTFCRLILGLCENCVRWLESVEVGNKKEWIVSERMGFIWCPGLSIDSVCNSWKQRASIQTNIHPSVAPAGMSRAQ